MCEGEREREGGGGQEIKTALKRDITYISQLKENFGKGVLCKKKK